MTSLVTHRMTMAIGILTNVQNNTIPSYVKFRHESKNKQMLPPHTYELEHDTGIIALDTLLAYLSSVDSPPFDTISWNHRMIALIAARIISTHGWGQATSDAITVVWMATVGIDAFMMAHGVEPSARMQFYNKGLEDGFFYTCSEWKEFL